MAVMGFQYRYKCPADANIPHYLFFGGICGLIAISMRLLMIITWYYMSHVSGAKEDENVDNNKKDRKNNKTLHYDQG